MKFGLISGLNHELKILSLIFGIFFVLPELLFNFAMQIRIPWHIVDVLICYLHCPKISLKNEKN